MTFENSAPETEVAFKEFGQKRTWLQSAWLRGPPDENGWFQLKNQKSKRCLAAESETKFTIQGTKIHDKSVYYTCLCNNITQADKMLINQFPQILSRSTMQRGCCIP